MGAFSISHLLVVLLVVVVVFGVGKLPQVMGDVAKGVKAFKKGIADEGQTAQAPVAPTVTAAEAPVASAPQRPAA